MSRNPSNAGDVHPPEEAPADETMRVAPRVKNAAAVATPASETRKSSQRWIAESQAGVPRTGMLSASEGARRFELLALAGSGGMGDVYRARDVESDRTLALKLLPCEGDERRFMREAAVLATFDHPGVVRYETHGIADDGTPFLAMEWLVGADLNAALGDGTLDVASTLALARRVAEALAAAHVRGIVHRDVKPANIFLVGGRVETPKLLDFGLAREVADNGLTAPGTVLGTPAYMAPEQIRGEAVDARADVYGLGAVIYRCLAGTPPFGGAHRIAVLAKVLVEEPQSLRRVRPDVPLSLDALVASMLAKEAARRPPGGAAVLEALLAIRAEPREGAAKIDEPASVREAITAREQRVSCVVLCSSGDAEDITLGEEDAGRHEVREAVEERGGVLETLARGTWLITIPGAGSPAEQAERALRSALAISASRSGARVAVATGRVIAMEHTQVGEAIDRAAAGLVALRTEGRGGVLADETTAGLVEDRFELSGDGAWREVLGERSAIAPVRTLLGRPASCLGRTQELATLDAVLDECASEPRARAVIVTSMPGFGKSRLVHELLRTAVASRGDVDVIFTRADAVRSGSPFGVASYALRGVAGILDSDGADARADKLHAMLAASFAAPPPRRVEEMLSELCGAPVPHDDASPALRAARADAAVMVDALRDAWIEWLQARGSSACTLLVVEDLHWADLPSVRLIDAALDALADRPLMVLATARPEVFTRFPNIWQRRSVQQVNLGPLTKSAAQRLVRDALGGRANDAIQRAIVDRAAGHPFHLEELVRAVAAGQGPDALPDSVLGMIQARLDDVSPVGRRALRAASVFGETFYRGGVEALMGDDASAEEVALQLSKLAAEEVVTRRPSSKLVGETEYTFRHALVRDAAYATLTDHDRRLAHRLAGAWLERVGQNDPAMLAEHYYQGRAPDRALGFFRRAAEQALEASDFERATSYVGRAFSCEPGEADEGALRGVQAEVSYWKGALDEAAEAAATAADHLEAGTPAWLGAASIAIGALGQCGKNDRVAAWLERAARAPAFEGARGAHVVTLSRGLLQLYWAHYKGDLSAARARFEELVGGDASTLEPHEQGWVYRARGESAWLHGRDVDRCLTDLAASCDAFERAGAHRHLCLTRMNLASLAGWSGDTERGLDLVDRAHREATRLGSGFLMLYGSTVRGVLQAFAGLPEAADTLRTALPNLAPSPRLAFLVRFVLASIALDHSDASAAEEHADAAAALPVVADLKPAGFAIRARVRVALGRTDDGLADAREAAHLASERSDLELTEGAAHLALAEALEAHGDREGARAAIVAGHAELEAIAKTIASRSLRERFWQRRLSNDRIAASARTFGDPTRLS